MIPRRLHRESVDITSDPLDYSHIPNDRDDFYDGKEELGFAVSFDTKQIDRYDNHQEDRNEYGMVMLCVVPKVDSNRCSNDFQRKDSKPLQSIILRTSA